MDLFFGHRFERINLVWLGDDPLCSVLLEV